ncbi:hypothetical protein C8Q74DRAFT_1363934 [Fomes fomentarius]|nr:hypothetical protein C8Q74DRAFT_1363934 [Fomes fomentarius]
MADGERVTSYAVVAAAVLFWYDWILTISDEVHQLWKRPFTVAMVIYILIRYTLLVQQAFVLLGGLPMASNRIACFAIVETGGVLLVVSNIACSVLIILRVYAVCARSWKPLLAIVPLALTHPILGIFIDLELESVLEYSFGPSPGCKALFSWADRPGDRLYYIRLVILIVANATLVAITWSKTLGTKRAFAQCGVRAPLTTLLVRDGSVYFLLLIANAAVNIPSVMPIGYKSTTYLLFSEAWTYFYPVFNVMIFTRFMLALRGIYFDASDATEDSDGILSSVRFRGSRVIGNLGAPVRAGSGTTADGDDEWEIQEPEDAEFDSDPFRKGMREAAGFGIEQA